MAELAEFWRVKAHHKRISITAQDVEDIMVTALEGGIGYWACLNNSDDAWNQAPEEEPVSITAAKLLLDGQSLQFLDAESDNEPFERELTLTTLLSGIEMFFEEYEDAMTEATTKTARGLGVDCGQIDSMRADIIIQFAMFDEVIFG